jgi:hypothetical protein
MVELSFNQSSLTSKIKVVRHKLKPNANVFRILPPFGDPDDHNGYPFKRWSVAWLTDPQSGKRRPFASPIMEKEECPVDQYSRALAKHIENKKAMLTAEGLDEKQVREQLKDLYNVQWQIKLNHTYAYNAVDKEGTVGVLEVKKTAHDGIKEKLNEYIVEYNQDPLSLESDIQENAGVWLNIKKTGEGKDTKYTVDFAKTKKKVDGDVAYVLDRSPLPDSVAEGYHDGLGYDLTTLYYQKSAAQLREVLLYNLSLIQEEVPDAILDGFEPDVEVEEPVEKPKAKAKPKKKVELNLDEDDEPPFDVEAPVKKTTKRKEFSNDDIVAMADDLLEG